MQTAVYSEKQKNKISKVLKKDHKTSSCCLIPRGHRNSKNKIQQMGKNFSRLCKVSSFVSKHTYADPSNNF